MCVLDRYLIILFTRIFAICFISLTGLIIVVDTFSNLEEFLSLAKMGDGLLGVLSSYYVPRIFLLFDQLAPIVALIAGICSLLWMRRCGELAAVEAGGIPVARMAIPIICCTAILVVVSILNRELVIPRFSESLAKNAQSWDDSVARPVIQQKDSLSDIWIRGTNVVIDENRINGPEFQLPTSMRHFSSRLSGEWADYLPENEQHPAGYLFFNVTNPPRIDTLDSQIFELETVILTRKDHSWISEGSCFVVSEIQPEQLANSQSAKRFSSTWTLMKDLQHPSMVFSNRHKVNVHSRFVRPLLDMSILLIGLPLVISRRDRNVFYAAGICSVVVVGILLLNMACQGMGAARFISHASFAAWLPVLIVVPFTAVSVRWLFR